MQSRRGSDLESFVTAEPIAVIQLQMGEDMECEINTIPRLHSKKARTKVRHFSLTPSLSHWRHSFADFLCYTSENFVALYDQN